VITSALTALGGVGTSFRYQITATNGPTSFGATPLPAGLVFNSSSGVIAGTPAATGVTNVTISATNAGGTGSATLTITVASPCDLNGDGVVNSTDVQLSLNATLGTVPCGAQDLDGNGKCDVVDVQRVIEAALGSACRVGP
jgi:hypothetical protein